MPDNVNRPGKTVEDEFSHLSSPGFIDILLDFIRRRGGAGEGVSTIPDESHPLAQTNRSPTLPTEALASSVYPSVIPNEAMLGGILAGPQDLAPPPPGSITPDWNNTVTASRLDPPAPPAVAPVYQGGSNYPGGPITPDGKTLYPDFAINALEAGDTVQQEMRKREQPTLMGGGVDLSSLFQKGKDIFFSDPMQNFFQLSRDALAQPVNPGDWGVEPFARAQVARNQLEYERGQTRLDREIQEADLAARREATAYDRRLALENLEISKKRLALAQNPPPKQPTINKVTIAAMADVVASLEKNDVINIDEFSSWWKPGTPDADEAREAIALAALEIQKNSPETSPTDAIIQAIASLRGQGEAPANGANAPVQNGSISGATSGDLNISGKTPAVIN